MNALNPTLLYVHYAQHKKKFMSTHVFPSRMTHNYELGYFLNDSSCKLVLDHEEHQITGDTVVFRRPRQHNQSFMPYESILIGFTFDDVAPLTSSESLHSMSSNIESSILHNPLLSGIATVNHPLKQTNYRQIFEDIYKESLLSREFSLHYYRAKILEILYSLYYERNSFITHRQQNITDNNLIDLLKYIEINLDTVFTIQTMSTALSISERHIYNLFKKHLNITPLQYINESKINYAKNLLNTSNLPVHEIAHMCGYENSTYFITLFRKVVGQTPLKYRLSLNQYSNITI